MRTRTLTLCWPKYSRCPTAATRISGVPGTPGTRLPTKPISITSSASERPMICSAVMGEYTRTSSLLLFFRVFARVDVEFVQRAMHDRREENADAREKRHAAEQRVTAGEDFSARGLNR